MYLMIKAVYDIQCTVAAVVFNTRCSCRFHLRKGLPLGLDYCI